MDNQKNAVEAKSRSFSDSPSQVVSLNMDLWATTELKMLIETALTNHAYEGHCKTVAETWLKIVKDKLREFRGDEYG